MPSTFVDKNFRRVIFNMFNGLKEGMQSTSTLGVIRKKDK